MQNEKKGTQFCVLVSTHLILVIITSFFVGCSTKPVQKPVIKPVSVDEPIFPVFDNKAIIYITKEGLPANQKPLPAFYTMSELKDPISGVKSWTIHNYDNYTFRNDVAVLFQYKALKWFEYGFKYTIISRKDFSITPFYADFVTNFESNRMAIKKSAFSFNPFKKKKLYWIYLDSFGQRAFPEKYVYAEKFSEGKSKVFKKGRYYVINEAGTNEFEMKYESSLPFSDSLAVVKKANKWGAINHDGVEVIPVDFEQLYNFSDGMAKFKQKDRYGFVNKFGQIVIPAEYDKVLPFCQGYGIIIKDSVYSFVNKNGEVKATGLQHALPFSDSLSAAQINKKWGFINTQFEWVIPPIYERVDSFNNGLGIIWSDSMPWYINKKGELIAQVFTKKELERFWRERD